MKWRKLVERWKWAEISDAAFIFIADEIGKGAAARFLVQKDLEIP